MSKRNGIGSAKFVFSVVAFLSLVAVSPVVGQTGGTGNAAANTAAVLGTTADAAYAGSGNATVDAILKGIYANTAAFSSTGLATSAKQDTGNTSLASILAKITSDPATQTTLAAVLAKLTSDPSTATLQGTTNTDLGPPGATACATDTGSCSLNALLQRLAQRLTTVNTTIGAPFQAAGALGAGSALIGKVDHAATGIGHGFKTSTSVGTAVALAGSTAAKFVTLQAYRSNTGYVAIGATGVSASATAGTGTGLNLAAGESITIPIDNLADVFIDVTVSGEGVRYTYGN